MERRAAEPESVVRFRFTDEREESAPGNGRIDRRAASRQDDGALGESLRLQRLERDDEVVQEVIRILRLREESDARIVASLHAATEAVQLCSFRRTSSSPFSSCSRA